MQDKILLNKIEELSKNTTNCETNGVSTYEQKEQTIDKAIKCAKQHLQALELAKKLVYYDENVYEDEIRKAVLNSEISYFNTLMLMDIGSSKAEYISTTNTEIHVSQTYRLSKIEHGYELIIPTVVSNYVKKDKYSGAFLHKITAHLIEKYRLQTREEIKPFPKATLRFTHYFKHDNLYKIPDPDNLNVKPVIDELQGVFINNDSLIDITLIQQGAFAKDFYTKVEILNGK